MNVRKYVGVCVTLQLEFASFPAGSIGIYLVSPAH